MAAKYVLGIDLGTTNSVLAYTPVADEHARVEILPIPQLVAASTVDARPMLPSFLYLGTDADASSAAFDLPWQRGPRDAVGELARRQSADVPKSCFRLNRRRCATSWLRYCVP